MKKIFILILLSLPGFAGYGQITIDLAGYPLSTTGWTPTSTTSVATVVDSTFKLTTTATNTASKIYNNTSINMAAWCRWTADFDFKIVPGSGGTADGLAFWFLSSVSTALTSGGGIGLPTNPVGMVLIFDTYNNNSAAGADNPLVTLLGYDGTTTDYQEGSSTGQIAPIVTNQTWVANSAWHHVKVTYYLGVIKVYLNGSATPNITTTVPYPITITGNFGFSASTGAVSSTQSIKAVHIVVSDCLTALANGPVCQGDTLRLTALGDSTSATYLWSGPNGFTSTEQNPIRPVLSYLDSGDYTVIKTFSGIADTESVHFSVKHSPVITAGSNSPVCDGGTINLTSGPDSTGETYSWTGGVAGTFTSVLQNPSISLATQSDSGTYTVIATWNGCKDTASVYVDVVHVAVPFDSSNSPLCNGDTLRLYARDSVTGVAWNWTAPDGFTSALQNPIRYNVLPAQAGVYTVTATVGACTATDTILIVINTTPTLPDILPRVAICSGQTITLTIDPASVTAGANYYWTGPNGYTSTNINNTIPNATMAAGGIYSVFAVNGNCSTTVVHNNFGVDSTPVVPTAANNGPICSDSVLLLTSSDATAGVTYSWAGPAAFTSTDQNPVINGAQTTMSGNYTVTATLHLCSSKAITNVLINQTPKNPIVGSNGPLCGGQLLNLNASFTPYTGAFYWTGPNGFTAFVQNPSILNVTNAAAGTYNVFEILNGCTSDTAHFNVVILSTPAPPLVSNNSPICEGDTLRFYATDDTAGVTYGWAGPAGFSSTAQNPIIPNATPATAGVYTATATLGTCSATSTTNVVITTTPPLVVTSNSPVCTGDTLKLNAASLPGNTYVWSGPYIAPPSPLVGPSPIRYPAIMEYAGVYSVTTRDAGGCQNSGTVTVIIKPTPVAPWIAWMTLCQFDYAPPLMAIDATNVLWFPSSAAGGIGSATPPGLSTSTPGVFFYYLNQTVNGCVSPIDSVQVIVNPKPAIIVTPADTAICPRESVPYRTIVNDPLATVKWYPTQYLSDSVGATTTAHPVANINYYAIATNLYNCADSAFASVTVHPSALISIPVVDSVTLYPGESFQIQPITNCTSFNWFPPQGLSSPFISDPVATPEDNTMYVVSGSTENGCVTSDSVYFHVNADNTYALPNAFTPGTGVNNEFKLLLDGVAKLNYFRIYNRWGELVFETKNVSEGWDGTYKGVPQPFGVYVYDIQAVSSLSGKIKSMRGNVTLLR